MDHDAAPTLDVALVTETYPPEVNGVSMTLKRVVDGCRALGHRVTVIRPRQASSRPVADEWSHPGFPLPGYRGLQMGYPRRAVLQARWRIAPPDVVHVATEGPLGLCAMRAARRLGIPVTSSFHTNYHAYAGHYGCRLLGPVVFSYLRRFHNRTACTMVPTPAQARDLGDHGLRRATVLARGIDAELFSPRRRSAALRAAWGLDDDDLVIGVVSRIAAEKNIELTYRAFRAARAMAPTARLLLVGDGPEAGRYRDRDGVIWAGMRHGEDLAAHYASCDLFAFASLTETYGNVVTEAMASGVATVAFDYAAAATTIVDGHNGRLAPYGDEAAFMAAVCELAAAPQARARMATAARSAVAERSWSAIAACFIAHLQRACMSPQPAPGRAPCA